uniref:Gelsolin-like domain-containing protein n=1 Tax=Macrostomum lignano TaxID=282301 RepID=A0A1I8J6J7_9PLAT
LPSSSPSKAELLFLDPANSIAIWRGSAKSRQRNKPWLPESLLRQVARTGPVLARRNRCRRQLRPIKKKFYCEAFQRLQEEELQTDGGDKTRVKEGLQSASDPATGPHASQPKQGRVLAACLRWNWPKLTATTAKASTFRDRDKTRDSSGSRCSTAGAKEKASAAKTVEAKQPQTVSSCGESRAQAAETKTSTASTVKTVTDAGGYQLSEQLRQRIQRRVQFSP